MNKMRIYFTYYGVPYVAVIEVVVEDEKLFVNVLSCRRNYKEIINSTTNCDVTCRN